MTRIEKSIRSALNYYGPGLRAGHWTVPGQAGGVFPKRGVLRAAFADIDSNGLVYDIRLYAYGEIMLRSDGEVNDETHWTIDITDEIENYITGYHCYSYDELIGFIRNKVWQKMRDNQTRDYFLSDIAAVKAATKGDKNYGNPEEN